MDILHRSGAFVALLLSIPGVSASADQHLALVSQPLDWQVQRLFTPSTAQLAAGHEGRVYIYDSLEINQGNEPMDRHFDRIQHMMFTRIYHPPKHEGSAPQMEEDGCE